MKALSAFWKKLQARYELLNRRERILVAAALVAGPLLIGNSLLIDPQLARLRSLETSLLAQKRSQTELQTQIAVLQAQLANDPDAPVKAELAALLAMQAGLDEEVLAYRSNLVLPGEMNGLLERLLQRHSGLRLISLKTLAPSSVLPAATDAADAKEVKAARDFDLFKHGVEIRIEGRYEELQAYLAQLEQLQQRLLWGKLRYQVLEYPRAELTVTVYTLSPERAWLSL